MTKGIYKNADGYIYFRVGKHPGTTNCYIKRATIIAEKKIGHPLHSEEIVHHINHIRDDDRPENLAVITRTKHNKVHRFFVKNFSLIQKHTCLQCGNEFEAYPSANRKFCGYRCSVKYNKPRQGKGIKLDAKDVVTIKQQSENGNTQRAIAGHFNISCALVNKIVNNKVWRHV